MSKVEEFIKNHSIQVSEIKEEQKQSRSNLLLKSENPYKKQIIQSRN